MLVLGWIGLRFGEAVALQAGDVDTLRRRIRVSRSATEVRGRIEFGTPKSHDARTVAVPAFLVDDLALMMNGARERLLFRDSDGGPIRGELEASGVRSCRARGRPHSPTAAGS